MFFPPIKVAGLDTSKLDYRIYPYTNSSQLVEGVYPDGMTKEQIEPRIKGSFGGRFQFFDDGKFRYIAYTD